MKPQNPDVFKDFRNESDAKIRELIDSVGGPRYTNEAGMTLLHFAVDYTGNARIIELLIKWGADKNALASGVAPLHGAVMTGILDAAEALLRCGANVNVKGLGGITPLHATVKSDISVEMAKLLLHYKADFRAKTDVNQYGKSFTPLEMAKNSNDIRLFLLLLNCEPIEMIKQEIKDIFGDDLDSQDKDGWTLLHTAVYDNYINLANALLSMGVRQDLVEENGFTPLYMAVANGRPEIVKLLLPYYRNEINKRDKWNLTMLHAAAASRQVTGESNVAVVKILVENGADINADSASGSPLDLAKKVGDTAVVQYLTEVKQAAIAKAQTIKPVNTEEKKNAICSKCGKPLPIDMKFCGYCGAPVSSPATIPTTAVPSRQFTEEELQNEFKKAKQFNKEGNFEEEVRILELIAPAGHVVAQSILGDRYYYGDGVAEDATKAAYWFLRAAEQGHARAQCDIGYCYENGEGVEKDNIKAFEWYLKSAEQGHAQAQYNLGQCYKVGRGVEKDVNKAFPWFLKAAEQGHEDAQNNVGLAFFNGRGVAKDMTKAVEWYQKAALQGEEYAQNNLGLCYKKGDGVEKDLVKALEWFTKAAEQGHRYAQYNLAECYANGEGTDVDTKTAFEWYLKAAQKGHPDAQYKVGRCYDRALGTEKDDVKAFQWYLKAAEQGNADAQNAIGYSYEYGESVEKDLGKAIEWYRKAAEQGHARAQCNLGFCYERGVGVAQDNNKAFELYSKSAEQGLASAQLNLSNFYREGKGTEVNLSKMIEWIQKAAEQGNSGAQLNLGIYYYVGFGIQRDVQKAFEWNYKAAEQGQAGAQDNLGLHYTNGDGVAADTYKAFEWYKKAAEQGHANAQACLGLRYIFGDGCAKDVTVGVEWLQKAMAQGNQNAKTSYDKLKSQGVI